MAYQPTPDTVIAAVREMHPDTFTQAAILRVYANAPGLLNDATVVALQDAYAAAETTTTDPQED